MRPVRSRSISMNNRSACCISLGWTSCSASRASSSATAKSITPASRASKLCLPSLAAVGSHGREVRFFSRRSRTCLAAASNKPVASRVTVRNERRTSLKLTVRSVTTRFLFRQNSSVAWCGTHSRPMTCVNTANTSRLASAPISYKARSTLASRTIKASSKNVFSDAPELSNHPAKLRVNLRGASSGSSLFLDHTVRILGWPVARCAGQLTSPRPRSCLCRAYRLDSRPKPHCGGPVGVGCGRPERG